MLSYIHYICTCSPQEVPNKQISTRFVEVEDVVKAHRRKRLPSSVAAVQQMPTILATAQTHHLFLTTTLESAALHVSTSNDYNEPSIHV